MVTEYISLPFVRLANRLQTTLQHMEVVHSALVKFASHGTPAANKSSPRAIANHAIRRNAELAVQLLYTHFSEYLRGILLEMYAKRPLEVVDKAQSTLRFHELVRLGSYQAICAHMVDHVFR